MWHPKKVVCFSFHSAIVSHPLDFFVGERALPGLEVFFHVLLVRGSGQRQQSDQHREAKDDLRDSSV